MAGAKGSNASKASSKAVAPGQQNLFQFYKKQPKPNGGFQRALEAVSGEAAPAGSNAISETPLSPKEKNVIPGLEVFLLNPVEPSGEQHPAAEKRFPDEETQLYGGRVGDHDVYYGKDASDIHHHRQPEPPSQPEATSIQLQQKVGVAPLPFAEQKATPSTILPPKRTYPIFDKRPPNPQSHSFSITDNTRPADQHTVPSEQAPRVSSQVKEDIIIGANSHNVVDLTRSTATASPSPRHSVIIIDHDLATQGPPMGSQSAPIDLRSSPPEETQPMRRLHPFFASRVGKLKNDKELTRSESTSSSSGQWEIPWPDATVQHSRGPQSRFSPSGSMPFGKSRGNSRTTLFSSQSNLRFLDRPAVPLPKSSERQAASSSCAPTPLERKDAILALPSSHRQTPGISRLLDDHEDIKVEPHLLADDGELWTHKWRPRQAADVLGNEANALYLKAWLHALEIRNDDGTQMKNDNAKGNSEVRTDQRGTKRPIVVRAVNKKRGRKRRRVESDDESSLQEWIAEDGEEEMESGGTSDEEPFPRPSSPHIERSSKSPSAHMRGLDAMADDGPSNPRGDGLSHADFSHLTNTILLAGPPGSGKTSTVYACAEELGWEVFEVYPGIGKRSGINTSSLVGDLGKNHLVGRGGASKTNAKGLSIQPFFQPGFGYLSGERQEDATGTADRKRVFRQSIILLEEVDILYKEDANFWPTVVNIIKTSRRPIFMTCNDISLVPQDELPLQTCLVFEPCPSSLAVSFLQCICLAEGQLVPREQLEAVYAMRHEPIGSDEPDEPQVPYPSQPRPCSDLRRALNILQFSCGRESPTTQALQKLGITTSSQSEILADWSCSQDVSRGDLPGNVTPHGYELDQIWQHSESASYIDGYLERRSSDVLEALSIDRYGPSGDDEIGYTLLQKSRVGCSSGLAFYSRDDDIAREALVTSWHVLQTSGAGPRAIRGNKRGIKLDSRSLVWGRVANQTRVVSFLDDLIPLSAPLLPRPAVVLEYTPYVRQMVATDDALEAEASAASEPRAKRGRNTRNSWRLDGYPRYLTLSPKGLEAARRTVLA